jgi:hypothetical protein
MLRCVISTPAREEPRKLRQEHGRQAAKYALTFNAMRHERRRDWKLTTKDVIPSRAAEELVRPLYPFSRRLRLLDDFLVTRFRASFFLVGNFFAERFLTGAFLLRLRAGRRVAAGCRGSGVVGRSVVWQADHH